MHGDMEMVTRCRIGSGGGTGFPAVRAELSLEETGSD